MNILHGDYGSNVKAFLASVFFLGLAHAPFIGNGTFQAYPLAIKAPDFKDL